MPYSKFSITSNRLVEYMTSAAPARNRIIDKILKPEEFKPYLLWYKEYKPAFTQYMNTQDFAPSFNGLKDNLMRRVAKNSDEENKIVKELEAIDLTSKIEVFQNINGAKCFSPEHKLGRIEISELTISTGATNIVQSVAGPPYAVGLIVPYLKSTMPLNAMATKYHGALLHWFAEKLLSEFGNVDPKLCIVVDLFNSKTTAAPCAYKRIRADIEANCKEIYDRLQLHSLQTKPIEQFHENYKKVVPF